LRSPATERESSVVVAETSTGIEWDDADLDDAVKRVAAEGVIDAYGVRLNPQQLAALLNAAPVANETERPTLKEADFTGATFDGEARFDGATFSGAARFDGATFIGGASFANATFSETAWFGEATFIGVAWFYKATFIGDAFFYKATFIGDAWFGGATFSGIAQFNEATFSRDASFHEATFERSQVFGRIHVLDRIWLDDAVFAQRVIVEASALRASFARAVFRRGAALRLRWAEVWLEDTEFAEPSLVEGLQARVNTDGSRGVLGWEKPADDGTWACWLEAPPERFAPSVISLRDARVAQLTMVGADLQQCRFARAHGLDDLAYEDAEFGGPPRGWRWVGWRPVRWTQRRTIADEHHWRASRADRYGPGWDSGDQLGPDQHRGSGSDGSQPSTPWPPEAPATLAGAQIADIYRELRKGREDKKDEPGAADFYYGEMEMRRHSAPLAERAILWLYWMVSGYGLRASRALLALAVTIVVGAVLLHQFGFDAGKHPDNGTLLFALESSVSLLRAPEATLTPAGEVIQIVLRLAGPLFFGLALLALRGRVKR
jgi:uncharacterized protein YjbI with pentapeptide repeats